VPPGTEPVEAPPPIAQYAVIGDCRSVGLVSRTGSIDWCCWPRFDSPSLFGRLLDAQAGYFSVAPLDPASVRRTYVDETPVLRTVFETADAEAELIDLMPALSDREKRDRLLPFRCLIRRIRGLRGSIRFQLGFVPRPEYGRVTPRVEARGASHVCATWGQHLLQLGSDLPLEVEGASAGCTFTAKAGEVHDFVLAYAEDAPAIYPPVGDAATRDIESTLAYWRAWLDEIEYTGRAEDLVRRSALVIKLLAYAPSGALVAAPTTSLPEAIGGVRNWDYRYCWLRDAAYSARSLYRLGLRREPDGFVQWLLHATTLTHPRLQILYDLYGRPSVPDRTLDHLSGYRGSRPVRLGNGACKQFQLDVYGAVLDAVGWYYDRGGRLDADARKLVTGAAEFLLEHWAEPDHGIWELQAGRFQHVHGKVMAWLALDRAASLARRDGIRAPADQWEGAAQTISRTVLEQGFNREIESFTARLGERALDASVLALPAAGFIPGDEPRMVSTIDRIRSELAQGDLVYRYRNVDDGLPGDEGAFLVCSFWLVEALARAGRGQEAEQLFDRIAGRANDVGLFSEEIDVDSGDFLGNFPQALSHIGLIDAAVALVAAA
jgi:GH15 family glucan-1,4-alpha-glucosidase